MRAFSEDKDNFAGIQAEDDNDLSLNWGIPPARGARADARKPVSAR